MGKQSVAAVIFEYMKSQNRPYSATDVFLNLHKEHGKTAVVNAMESLVLEKKLLEKNYGKSKIYVVHQSVFTSVDDAELKKLDNDIASLNDKLTNSQSQLKLCQKEIGALQSSLTTNALKETALSLKKEVELLEKQLEVSQSAAQNFDPSTKNKVMESHKINVTHWRKRKRMASDLINAVLEGYPKSKKHFFDEVGIETDEDMSVKIPELK